MTSTFSHGVRLTRALFVLLALGTSGVQAKEKHTLLSFEDKSSLQSITVQGGQVSTSEQHSKLGEHSLKWKFSPEAKLTINRSIGFLPYQVKSKDQARHSFMTWLYNETPIADQLIFQFGSAERNHSHFSINLNFSGWRAIAIPFESDMQGQPDSAMRGLTITAPKHSGTLYFDLMALSIPVDPRWPTPDYQAPFINKTIATLANAHWGALLQYDNWQQQFESQSHQPVTQAERDALTQISQRIDQDLQSKGKPYTRKQINKLLKKSNSLVEKDQGELKPIQMWRQVEVYQKAKINAKQYKQLNKQTLSFQKLGKHLLTLVDAYFRTEHQGSKEKLRQQFSRLVTHLLEQGYTRGSAVGIMHHQGYSMREWSTALYLGRHLLSPELTTQAQQSIAWLTGLGRIFRPEQENNGFNVDVMNTFMPAMLMSILMQPEPQQQVAYLRQLSKWMSYSMLATKGLGGGIQPDGSFFHHSQHYVAYGNGGLKGLTPVVYYLSHSPYAINMPAYRRLRHAVLMTRVFSNGNKVPMSLTGRHPEKYQEITLQPFKYLTLMGDKGVASAYLRLIHADPAKLAAQNYPIMPEASPSGSWAMNYSSMAIQRRDEWLATVRGFSRYLVGNESYANANHFGRYVNYGHLEILPSSTVDSGYSEAGWDWNRWPGTTSVQLPIQELAADINQIDQYSGIEEMLLSTERFSGANQLADQNAMFAMKLRGHAKYNDDLQANKSVFFFDNRIVALGSNIASSDKAHPVATTLFQQSISDDQASFIGGQAITGNNTDKTVRLEAAEYYMDTRSNAYFVAAGQQLSFSRKTQQSFENEEKKPTQGDFTSLVIQHGEAPQNGSYQYMILVGADADQAHQLQQKINTGQLPYQVLRQDKQAHIVHDQATDITGYALFEANPQLLDQTILANDTPLMVMAHKSDGKLSLAVTDPDLNLYQGQEKDQLDSKGKQKEVSIYSRKWRYNQPQAKKARLTLKGHWHGQGDNYKVIRQTTDHTTLEVTSLAATPVQIELSKD